MRPPKYMQNVLIGATAALFAGVRFIPGSEQQGPVLTAATEFVTGKPANADSATKAATAANPVALETSTALTSLSGSVRKLSRPEALEYAFRGYFTYKAAHPDEVRKPFLYFVDYGLPSTEPRGYVFDMESLKVVDGPFTVAHGRGSSAGRDGVPTRFSNTPNSAATSLGLYVAKETYTFTGHAGGRAYRSIGMRLAGVSRGFNDMAYVRRVVAHGAPYVTASKAGRSEGCPALEPQRAQELLPKLANGGMVFLFAPDERWMSGDQWVAGGNAS